MFSQSVMIYGINMAVYLQLFLLGACHTQATIMAGKADFGGFITAFESGPGSALNTIYAESHADKLVHRCEIEVNSETTLLRWDGQELKSIPFDQIRKLDKIKVWFVNASTEPFPKKGIARKIIVATAIPLDSVD